MKKKKIFLTSLVIMLLVYVTNYKTTVNVENANLLAATLKDTTLRSNLPSAINSFKSSISDMPLFSTNKFDCVRSNNNISCGASSYQNVGLFSGPEYLQIGGSNSYLYSSKSWYALDAGNTITIMPSGIVTDEPAYVKASVYVPNIKIVGSGSSSDPYQLSTQICFNTGVEETCEDRGGSLVGVLPIPERVGYTFNGWYSAPEGGFLVTPTTKISELTNNTMYARWTPNTYSLSYDLQYGSLDSKPSTATYDVVLNVNNPTKTVTFKGNENGTGATIGANTTNAQNFAGWDITGLDNTTHEYGGSTTTNTSISKSYETEYKNLRSTDGTVAFKARWETNNTNLPTATKAGYTCGWSTTSGATTVSTIAVPENNSGTLNLYAVCNPNVYTITLDNQSATSAGTTKIYESYGANYSLTSGGSATTTITKPSKTNYVFGGYYTAANGSGTQVVDASGTIKTANTTFSANTTVYAYWKPVVTVTCNNCTSSPTSKEADYNGSVAFTITANTGYTLTGATVSGSGCSLTNGTLTASAVTAPRTCTISAIKTYSCAAGTYLPANATACATCPAGSYCTGYNGVTTSSNSGIAACSSLASEYTSAAGATASNKCYKTITVTYNGNSSTSGSVSNSTCSLYYGSSTCSITLRANGFTKTNYTFKGYGTNTTTVAYNASTAYNFSANATLYAIWEINYDGIASKTYSVGEAVTYEGIEFQVVKDNGDSVTLVTKNNVSTGAYGTSTTFSGSTVSNYLNTTWVNNNAKIKSEIDKGGILTDSSTGTKVRLLTSSELSSSLPNGSGTNFWTLTASGSNLYYGLPNGTNSYTKYTASANTSGTCYSGSSTSLTSISKSYNKNTISSASASAVASPSATSAVTSMSYSTAASGTCTSSYNTGSQTVTEAYNCTGTSCSNTYQCTKSSTFNTTKTTSSRPTSSSCTGYSCAGYTTLYRANATYVDYRNYCDGSKANITYSSSISTSCSPTSTGTTYYSTTYPVSTKTNYGVTVVPTKTSKTVKFQTKATSTVKKVLYKIYYSTSTSYGVKNQDFTGTSYNSSCTRTKSKTCAGYYTQTVTFKSNMHITTATNKVVLTLSTPTSTSTSVIYATIPTATETNIYYQTKTTATNKEVVYKTERNQTVKNVYEKCVTNTNQYPVATNYSCTHTASSPTNTRISSTPYTTQCNNNVCQGYNTYYQYYLTTQKTSTPYTTTCGAQSATCGDCYSRDVQQTIYTASGSSANWDRYVVSQTDNPMGYRAVITVKKK